MVDNNETAAKIARRIVTIQAEQAELEEAIQNLKGKLAEVLPEGDNVVGDNEQGFLKVVVYQSKQFNEAYGKKNHPELWEKHAVNKRVLDSATAKAAIKAEEMTEDEYALFQKPSDKKSVKIELVDD